MRKPLAVMTVFVFLCIPLTSFAGWVLYDNFNSGVINPDKWTEDASSLAGPIVVENGAAKFVQKKDQINDSNFLGFKKSPEKIKAVRVRVKIASQETNVFARIGGYMGEDEDGNPLWNMIRLRTYQGQPGVYYQAVEFNASFLSAADTNVTLQEFVNGYFRKPLAGTYTEPEDLTDEWITLEIHFTPWVVTYGVVNYRDFITSLTRFRTSTRAPIPTFSSRASGRGR